MRSLQEYIIESQQIEEGKILDSIKNWFKNLFAPSNKKFDRYGEDNDIPNRYNDYNNTDLSNNKFSGDNLIEFEEYINSNFSISKCKVLNILQRNLEKIIMPHGVKPDNTQKTGFYNFIDNLKSKENLTYLGILYEDDNVRDICSLVQYIKIGNLFKILNYQTLEEYSKVMTIKNVIDLLIDYLKKYNQKNSQSQVTRITIDKNDDTIDLFNKLVNDCNFTINKDSSKKNEKDIAYIDIK